MTNFIIRIYIEDTEKPAGYYTNLWGEQIGEFRYDNKEEADYEYSCIDSAFSRAANFDHSFRYKIYIEYNRGNNDFILPSEKFVDGHAIHMGWKQLLFCTLGKTKKYFNTESGKRFCEEHRKKATLRKVSDVLLVKPYNKIRKHIPFLIFVGLWCWGAMAIKNCANDHAEEEKNKEKTERMLRSSNNMNLDAPAALLDHGVADDNAEGGEVPQWCGELGGDTAKVRKIFLQSMKVLYGDNPRDPGRITFEIKGNNLYMYSYQFKEESTAWVSQIEFYQYFQDCDFDTVFAYAGNYGGAHGWTVYHRGDEKNEFGDTSDMPKYPKVTLWDVITGNDNKISTEYHKQLMEWCARKDKQYNDAADAYRARFIAHKDSLYAQRRMKK